MEQRLDLILAELRAIRAQAEPRVLDNGMVELREPRAKRRGG